MLDRYVKQVRLLLSVLPDMAREPVFALKGGTAINLFYRDMPRLSVDIDLTYLPVADRQSSLEGIDDALDRIMRATTTRNPQVAARRIAGGGDSDTRIMVSDGPTQHKARDLPGRARRGVSGKADGRVRDGDGAIRVCRNECAGLRGSVRREASRGTRSPAPRATSSM